MNIMRIRINKFDFRDELIIALLAIMDVNCFYLIKIPTMLERFWGIYQKTLLVVIAFLLFIWMKGVNDKNLFIKRYIAFLLVTILSVSIYSTLKYNGNSMHNILIENSHYFLVFLSVPLLKIFRRQGTYKKIFDVLNIVTLILYLVCIAQSIVYNNGGQLFIEIPELVRNDSLRISLKSFGNIMIIYNFIEIWCVKKKRKLFNLTQLILGVYCLVAIQQTRMYNAVILLTIVVVILISSKTPLRTFRNILLLAVLFFVLTKQGTISNFMNSFGDGSDEYQSTIARMGAFEYFWGQFVEKPLFGIGVIACKGYENIRTGPLGIYYFADVGIIGILAQLGVFTFGVYVWPLIHWCKIVTNKFSQLKSNPFPIAILCYLFLSTPTLICIMPALSFLWPFCFAIFEFVKETDNSKIMS